jgi:hypothetical protein
MKQILFDIAFVLIGAIGGWFSAVQVFNSGVIKCMKRLDAATQRLAEALDKINRKVK